jgi:hypothetical protein
MISVAGPTAENDPKRTCSPCTTPSSINLQVSECCTLKRSDGRIANLAFCRAVIRPVELSRRNDAAPYSSLRACAKINPEMEHQTGEDTTVGDPARRGEPRRQDETCRTVDLVTSDGPSWIDLAENRVNTTESRFAAPSQPAFQQNLPTADILNCE